MLAELAILGAVTSLLVQVLKKTADSKIATLAILVTVSFVLATAVWFLQEYNLWSWFLGIMATANLIYSFVIQHLEKPYQDWLDEADL